MVGTAEFPMAPVSTFASVACRPSRTRPRWRFRRALTNH
jgi:hypothetical protein